MHELNFDICPERNSSFTQGCFNVQQRAYSYLKWYIQDFHLRMGATADFMMTFIIVYQQFKHLKAVLFILHSWY